MTAPETRGTHSIRFLAGVVYLLCFVPAHFILRLCRHDPMQGKPDPACASYWKKREEHGLSKPMKYPF